MMFIMPLATVCNTLSVKTMNFNLSKTLIFLLFLSYVTTEAQTERETRAVWVATNHRLDWPPHTFNQENQKKALEDIFNDIKQKNLNTVFFQVRSNSTVMFKSSFDPFSPYFTGKMEMNGTYDPLEYAIESAHKKGLEIHAWINVVQCFGGTDTNIFNNPDHISKRKPEWVIEDTRNGAKSYWLDLGLPEVREYISDMIEEMVTNYDVAGVHLDYIRYPGKNFDDDFSYNIYNAGLSRDDWRRKNITDLIDIINQKIKAVKPYVKLGAAPIGIYKNQRGMFGWEGYSEVYQDSREWLKRGIVDYVAPQIYWSFTANTRFDLLAKEWVENSFGRNVLLGIAAYKPDVKTEIEKMIHYARDINADGVAFFRYSNIKDYSFKNFSYKTFPASMAWLPEVNPMAPGELKYFINNSKKITLEWNNKRNRANDSVSYYALYSLPHQSSEPSPDNLLDIIPADKSSIVMEIKKPTRINYFFALKSVSKLWNESIETSNVVKVGMPELGLLASASESLPNPVLIKALNGKTRVLIYSTADENIILTGENKQEKKELLSVLLKAGKNVISLPSATNNFESITVDYKTSGKKFKLTY